MLEHLPAKWVPVRRQEMRENKNLEHCAASSEAGSAPDDTSTRAMTDFDALRANEFARLDAHGVTYLDYTGAALHSASQAAAHAARITDGVYGNPHSSHTPSRASMADIAAARAMALAFFDADPDIYDIVLTHNASAAIRLVAESYPFGPSKGLVLSADNHNSMNGLREYAKTKDAPVHVLPLAPGLRLDSPAERLDASARRMGGGLLAFPGQSNFSGVRHDLDLIRAAQGLGFDVLLDAAGFGPSGDISLARHPADFLAFSFYKLFGLPTGMGALIVKHTALERLRRPWFSGGTVEYVSVAHDRHQLSPGHHGFEDGTPDFLSAGAAVDGFEFLGRIDRHALSARMSMLTRYALSRLTELVHADGSPWVELYGPADLNGRGGTIAFNLLTRGGAVIPYEGVEARAARQGIALRGGCFCNPGAAEAAFGHAHGGMIRCLDRLRGTFTPQAFRNCLGSGTAIGALRLSIGIPTMTADLDRAIACIAEAG
ncbi:MULTISPECIES: aminotransferase class V-fold PLP-dependent enzyme [Asticcacaulis]|uniref:aminotransferase class V-fold PLP-dependent enzyme n=1 Tax=Asticcacaulis TaxID=76890 RepID=UPI001AE2EFED|nr:MULTISPECIES: aminotransferase class V-fold PLP-dependent enzyme [Asticcacaulis]MBP2160343.1 selenocysteine lyase/cysteine desulfurase [Asticcacaulis solisilvae]MDR6801354.1 selenocysteine lyase/cysteine desulfurase [Asticcacaulis sp. BE141]